MWILLQLLLCNAKVRHCLPQQLRFCSRHSSYPEWRLQKDRQAAACFFQAACQSIRAMLMQEQTAPACKKTLMLEAFSSSLWICMWTNPQTISVNSGSSEGEFLHPGCFSFPLLFAERTECTSGSKWSPGSCWHAGDIPKSWQTQIYAHSLCLAVNCTSTCPKTKLSEHKRSGSTKQQQHRPHWGFTHNHVLHHKTKLTPMP